MAALLPALWMVQHERGWVSDDGDGRSRRGARAHAGVREGRRDVLHDVPPAPGREALHPGVHDVAVQRLRRRGGGRSAPRAHRLRGARRHVARRQVHGDRSRVPRRVRLRHAGDDQRRLHRVGDAGDGARDSRRARTDMGYPHTAARARDARSLQVLRRREARSRSTAGRSAAATSRSRRRSAWRRPTSSTS